MSLNTPLLPDGPAQGTGTKLLIAHGCTKFGSKAWEFATPLLLLCFTPGSLLAPTVFGLVIFMVRFVIGPPVGAWMDRTARMCVVYVGVAMQATGVVAALLVLGLLRLQAGGANSGGAAPSGAAVLVGLMIVCGTCESLGALISSVAVKKDWLPALWVSHQADEALKAQLASLNTAMSNIDLAAECLGPMAAGISLQYFGSAVGFTLVGIVNVVSFAVELHILLQIYRDNLLLSAAKASSGKGTQHACTRFVQAWPIFIRQPCGVPLLVASYSLLYVTALSPHGVVLTAYLQTRALKTTSLSLFRALGALSGVLGMWVYRIGARVFSVRAVALVQLWMLAVAVILAAAFFSASDLADGAGGGETLPMVAFLACVVVSRFGLYGFDLALLQLEQVNVDERYRGTVGAVESALCSFGTMLVFLGTLWVSSSPDASFESLVVASAASVSAGAICYLVWCLCWHEHEHSHTPGYDGGPHLEHAHTAQQSRTLNTDGMGEHSHLHFHLPLGDLWSHLLFRRTFRA